MTSLDVTRNDITGDGAQQLATVVINALNLEVFCGIPLKELREDRLAKLNLNGKGVWDIREPSCLGTSCVLAAS